MGSVDSLSSEYLVQFHYHAAVELQYYSTMLDHERRVNIALARLVQNLQHQLEESRASLARAATAMEAHARRGDSFLRLSEEFRKLTVRVLRVATTETA
jgi:TPP-dependent 2-oxoacid decarboxylase